MEIHNPRVTGSLNISGSLVINGASFNTATSGTSGASGATGTSNTVVKFASSTTVGNSNITDDGTNIRLNGNTTVTGSLNVTGSQNINGTLGVSIGGSTELNVQQTGVILGSVVTDAHRVTGSLNVSGSVTTVGTLSGTNATFTQANTAGIIDNNAFLRLVNTGTATLNQSVDLVMRWQDGTYNGTGGISMVRESATARSGRLILQPIDSTGNNVSALSLASTGAATFSGLINANFQTVAANGSINVESLDPAIRFRVTSGTANSRIYEWRAVAAGGVNDRMELRLWNDAQSSASTLFTVSSAGAGVFTSSVTASSIIRSGGTSSQFLKADGSVDSSTYLTSATVLSTVLTPYNVGANSAVTTTDTIETAIEKLQGQVNARLSSYTETSTLANVTARGATTNSSITVNGYLTVVGATTSSSIYMSDSDEGQRELHCNSNRIGFLTQAGAWGAWCNDDGSWASTGDITAFSDLRVKENVETITNALSKVTALRGVSYNRIDDIKKVTKIGVIAQETIEILPEVVQEQNDGMLTVSYGNMSGLFIEAFKEMNDKINTQANEINELKELVKQLINK